MAAPETLDAFGLLKQDHRTVENLFAQFEKAWRYGSRGREMTTGESDDVD